ncbi:MAG: hypothetical protein GKR91_05465 [Pseudomonadales bacterium]|nr:hypothetical protein [Pseudomonadales bacterium]
MQNLFPCKFRTTLFILPLILVACTNNTQLTFVSWPAGATITEITADNKIGIAPTEKSYDDATLGSVDSEGCYTLNGVEARWASGAVRRLPELMLCDGINISYTVGLVRPRSYPDLEKDLAVEKQLMLLRNSGFPSTRNAWHQPGRSGSTGRDIQFQRNSLR